MIRLYNSLSRKLEDFHPIDPNVVEMYVCGPTVYDEPHLGNLRPAVVFDTLAKLLATQYPAVIYARNYTDIDDKIMDRAKAKGVAIDDLTAETIAAYESAMAAFNVAKPDFTPRATDFVSAIIVQIAALLEHKHAYIAQDHVLFDVASWPAHGFLSGHKQEHLDAGHRVAVADYKRSPGDFVLWKPSTDDQPGWDSPWGRGRPGWHIECSSMIEEIFEGGIDIHGGGADLRFPHHECEISQFAASHHGRPLAHYWVHNALVLVNGQKMSKSLGNFITASSLIDSGVRPASVRLALLSTHYRSPLDWTANGLQKAHETLTGWHLAMESIEAAPERNEHAEPIIAALKSDLNTPLAISRIHDKVSELAHDPEATAAGIRYGADVLGLDLTHAEHDFYLRGRQMQKRAEIEAMMQNRIEKRRAKDFTASDALRDTLSNMGVVIEDGPRGTRWRLA